MSTGRSFRSRLFGVAVASVAITLGLPALSGLHDATVGAASPLTVSIGSASVVASARGQSSIFLPVTLSQASSSSVTVSYQTHDGTAQAGQSYAATTGTVTFAVDPSTGTTPLTQYAPVDIYSTRYPGGGGSFSVTLANPVGAKLGISEGAATILGRSSGRTVRVSAGDMSIYDGIGGGSRWALGLVTLSRVSSHPISVSYSVVPDTATPGTTFLAATTGTLDIEPGALSSWVGINVVSGAVRDTAKTITLNLTDASGATIGRSSGTVTLIPEPSVPAAPSPGTPTTQPSSSSTTSPTRPPTTTPGPVQKVSQPPATTPPTTPPTTATTQPKAQPAQAPAPGTVFDDEFNGTSLDLSKWQPNWLGNDNSTITKPVNGSELSCYDPAQVSVPGDGYLHLSAVARPCRANNGVTYDYASGLIESKPHFTFTYGYLEARMYLPPSAGRTANWPAFWTDGTGTWPTTGELDVMEGLHGSDCYHFHSPSGGPGGCASLGDPTGWHTFGARWSPGTVTFFYDGTQVGQVSSGVTSAPMYPILNLAVGGEGGTVVAPSTVLVDWVHITQ